MGHLVNLLTSMDKKCRVCIHPVAGRLPGHMNILSVEGSIPYPMVL